MTESPLIDRIAQKLGISCYAARKVRQAFVEALREEVEARFGGSSVATTESPMVAVPLVIAGLGSFRMVERPGGLQFRIPDQPGLTAPKPPARKLAFKAKWEPIK